MEKQVVVTCVYAEEGDAEAIIQESFRLFVRKELRELEAADGLGMRDA